MVIQPYVRTCSRCLSTSVNVVHFIMTCRVENSDNLSPRLVDLMLRFYIFRRSECSKESRCSARRVMGVCGASFTDCIVGRVRQE